MIIPKEAFRKIGHFTKCFFLFLPFVLPAKQKKEGLATFCTKVPQANEVPGCRVFHLLRHFSCIFL